MKIRKGLFSAIEKQKKAIHIVLIGTKPDIIKQAPLIAELKKRNHFVVVVHSGQHKQFNLTGGLEEEFSIVPDVNLEVSGNLYEQQSQIILRLGKLLAQIKHLKKQIIPYICADTTTAVAAGIASFANLISTAHVEAGLRTMSPPKDLILSLINNSVDIKTYVEELQKPNGWQKGSYEPYPEQFDTRAAGPSVGVHFAPVELNAQNLREEGYDPSRIFIVGNTVADVLELVKHTVKKTDVFAQFPALAKGELIRFCIHRRENITSLQRFMAIFEAMEALIKEGRNVVLISLSATEKALVSYNLKRKTIELANKYPNFVYSEVLPYYRDTVAIMQKCTLVVTDSGSIQEETNLLFNSDRPEAVFNGSNVIAPPISKEVILNVIHGLLESDSLLTHMRNAPKLYGDHVSRKIVRIIEESVEEDSSFNIFEFMEHQRLGLDKKRFWRKGGIQW